LEKYIKDINEKSKKSNTKVLLLGHKSDCEDKRQITKKEGSDFADLNNFLFFETTSLKSDEIINAFEQFIDDIKIEKYKTLSVKAITQIRRKKKCF